MVSDAVIQGPKDRINIRTSHSGSKAPYNGPYVEVAFVGPNYSYIRKICDGSPAVRGRSWSLPLGNLQSHLGKPHDGSTVGGS